MLLFTWLERARSKQCKFSLLLFYTSGKYFYRRIRFWIDFRILILLLLCLGVWGLKPGTIAPRLIGSRCPVYRQHLAHRRPALWRAAKKSSKTLSSAYLMVKLSGYSYPISFCLNPARASHSQRTCIEVSFSRPNFLTFARIRSNPDKSGIRPKGVVSDHQANHNTHRVPSQDKQFIAIWLWYLLILS